MDYDQWDEFLDDEGVDHGAVVNDSEFNGIRDPLTTLVPVVSTLRHFLSGNQSNNPGDE